MLWAGVCGGEVGVSLPAYAGLCRGEPGLAGSVEGVGVYAHGEGYDVLGDYGIILKKCDNVQVCACVGVGNGIKYARSEA